MKNKISLLFCATATILLSACTRNFSPEEQATLDLIIDAHGPVSQPIFNSFEILNSTTLGEELDRRKDLFETKIRVDESYLRKYTGAKTHASAQRHMDSKIQAEKIIDGLSQIREKHKAKLDSVVYRTYRFSFQCIFVNSSRRFRRDDMFVNITSDGTAYNLTSGEPSKNGMGFTVPGYKELLAGLRFKED